MVRLNLDPKGTLAAVGATATWASAGIFIKSLPGWSPWAILTARFLIATVVILPLVIVTPGAIDDLVRSLRRLPIWGLMLVMLGSYLFGTSALQLAPVGEATLLLSTTPLFIVAARYIARRPIGRTEIWGVLVAMVGVSLTIGSQLSTDRISSWQSLTGYLFALIAAGLLALYTDRAERLSLREIAPQPLTIVFATFGVGTGLFGAYTLLFSGIPTDIDRLVIWQLLGAGVVATAIPFWCYTVAARRLSPLLTTAILLLEPLFAALLAAIALHQIPSLWFGIGSILVFGGLLAIASANDA
jgi:drug/metabolite transporter (DMT)-like permease